MRQTVILVGDVRERLRQLPAESVHCAVTSPPYFGLRDYGMAAQIGLEATPDAYVAELVAVFREVRRVLRSDGTLWLNIGDSYNGAKVGSTNGGASSGLRRDGRPESSRARSNAIQETNMAQMAFHKPLAPGLASKQRLMIPARVALALQADGWWLRDEIIWHKPNPMPVSVTDRTTPAHEMLYMFSKSARYHYDMEAVKEPSKGAHSHGKNATPVPGRNDQGGDLDRVWGSDKRQPRSVWSVTPKPFKGAHFATFPPDLVRPCILAGCPEFACSACGAPVVREVEREPKPSGRSSAEVYTGTAYDTPQSVVWGSKKNLGGDPRAVLSETWRTTCQCNAPTIGGTVLDPFFGAGTTGLVAAELGRSAIGTELNPEYANIAADRLGLRSHTPAGDLLLRVDSPPLVPVVHEAVTV